ncbi:hypothetical protein jhhlp_007921 [Lomentospora prolificans]|uniref:alpha-L-rhamnosidase n=1 Tax=Lomentospora prolificans TaxID=41688 RepID=A0A2N3N0Y9_9PEZI|nr:hypothetical protein jhhlp_007921 [Lomentospora prolificans]
MASLRASELRFDHHPSGLGVHGASPCLSWKLVSTAASGSIPKDWIQSSYEVEVKRGDGLKIFRANESGTTLVPWPDKPLASRETALVRVRSTGIDGLSTAWSDWTRVEAALLARQDWLAEFITAPARTDTRHPDENGIRPVRFRKTFELDGPVDDAKLYITALGVYEAYLNGKRIGNECLAPGWTAYQVRIQYQVFDVSQLLIPGQPNVLCIEVAEGWYAGRLLWGDGVTCLYGDRLAALAQLHLPGGSCLLTDGSWECCLSPIVASGIYDGETYDLKLETDWLDSSTERASAGHWKKVEVLQFPKAKLVAASCPPVRVTQEIKPVKIFQDPDGKTLVDFGQNLVGKLHISKISRPEPTRVKIRYAEVLEHGRLGTRPLRAAKATDTVIFGSSTKTLKDWTTHFTYHGFRYIEITGWGLHDTPESVLRDSLTALVMHTDMRRTGFFHCSNHDVNKLHENACWSMRGNFVSIPTDCPQRDERLGWTGDIQVFSPTASFLFDSAGMLSNWMRDVIEEQKDQGGIVPLVVPNAMRELSPWPAAPQAVWDDVIIILPWNLYRYFGDVHALRASYPGMRDYLKSIRRSPDDLWTEDLWQLGDWLDPNAPPHDPGLARTDGVLVADAFLVHVTDLMAEIAAVLGEATDAARYASDAARLRNRFQEKYISRKGLVVGDSQTALALALVFGLHGDYPAQKTTAADRLSRLVRSARFRVSTGFAGTPHILHALSETGNVDLAYRMLLERECPSWLYPITMGATTIWERWDSMLPDGTINPGEMTSFNHYALGSVCDWIHANVGGISPLKGAGWRRFLVRPRPCVGGGITSAKTELRSVSGDIKCQWYTSGRGESFHLSLTVPPNTRALVVLPDGSEQTRGSGEYKFSCQMPSSTEAWPPKALATEFQ